jgi:hypothetical protein
MNNPHEKAPGCRVNAIEELRNYGINVDALGVKAKAVGAEVHFWCNTKFPLIPKGNLTVDPEVEKVYTRWFRNFTRGKRGKSKYKGGLLNKWEFKLLVYCLKLKANREAVSKEDWMNVRVSPEDFTFPPKKDGTANTAGRPMYNDEKFKDIRELNQLVKLKYPDIDLSGIDTDWEEEVNPDKEEEEEDEEEDLEGVEDDQESVEEDQEGVEDDDLEGGEDEDLQGVDGEEDNYVGGLDSNLTPYSLRARGNKTRYVAGGSGQGGGHHDGGPDEVGEQEEDDGVGGDWDFKGQKSKDADGINMVQEAFKVHYQSELTPLQRYDVLTDIVHAGL